MSPFLARIIALVLRLSPKEFHDRFGAEVEDGMERGLRDAGQRGGAIAMLGFWSRGVGDALKTVAHERHIEGRGWFGRGSPWSDLGGDVKYALRGWRRSPGFAITVITTLALGLGLTAAIFAFADGYLFRSLPFPGSERAFRVQYLHPERAGDSRLPRSWFLALSRFDVEALRQSAVAEYGFVEWGKALQGGFTLDGDLILSDAKLPVTACSVSAGFRQTLKLPLVAGRDFTDEDHVAGAPLSHGLRSASGAASSIATRL